MTEDTKPTGKKPTHTANGVQEGKNGKSYFTRIGVAWQHANGKGLTVQLHFQPLDGRFVLFANDEKAA